MKISEIKKQLADQIPILSNIFTENIEITSLTFDKKTGLVTAVCATPHGLSSGRTVTITDADFETEIKQIYSADGIGYATTKTEHDLTEGWQDSISISGTTNFNGKFKLLEVPNRYQFTFQINGNYPAETAGSLMEKRLGYNGAFPVNVVDAKTFTYKPSNQDLSPTAIGKIEAKTAPRIMAVESADEISELINTNKINKPTLFITIEDVDANQDENLTVDVLAQHENTNDYYQLIIENISVLFVYPKKDSVGGAKAVDICDDVRYWLCRTLCGYAASTNFNDSNHYGITYVGDNTALSTKAYYVRDFNFQKLTEITGSDIYSEDFTRAFRDATLHFTDRDLSAIIDLDEVRYGKNVEVENK